jgi:dolichol-phosphate mannosyltransferase
VIPTYNEAENLPRLIRELLALPIPDLSILVVDDDSPDGTGRIAQEYSDSQPDRLSVLHRQGKNGIGSAYITGFQQAMQKGAEAIAQIDADFSHPPIKLVEMLEQLSTFDAVLGSRYIPGGKLDEQWPLWRKWLSAFGNIYARAILDIPIQDVTGGFRMWRKETLAGMPLERIRSNGYAFQVEMAYVAYRLGFTFSEVPFYFAERRWGLSKMSFNIQIEAARRVWQMLYEYRDLNPSKRVGSQRMISEQHRF